MTGHRRRCRRVLLRVRFRRVLIVVVIDLQTRTWSRNPAVFKDVLLFVLFPPPPGGPEGGSGLPFSFRSLGFGSDPGEGGVFILFLDRKYSWGNGLIVDFWAKASVQIELGLRSGRLGVSY